MLKNTEGQDKLNTQTILKLNKAEKKAINAKHSKTKLLWFSCLLRHSETKWAYSTTLLSPHEAANQ